MKGALHVLNFLTYEFKGLRKNGWTVFFVKAMGEDGAISSAKKLAKKEGYNAIVFNGVVHGWVWEDSFKERDAFQ
jgi:hypothetical protein